MLKITLLHYSSPPVVGGVESVMAHHARLLTDAGHRVTIMAGRGEQIDPRIRFTHIPLMDSRHADILAVKKQLDQGIVPDEFYTLVEQLFVTLEANTAGEDLVIAHNIASLNKNLPLTAALEKLSRTCLSSPLILWHHDLAWTTPRYQKELHPGYPWDLLKKPWQRAVQVVVSTLRQEELAQLYGIDVDQILVIPNGLDIQRFYKLEEQTVSLVSRLALLDANPLLLLPVRVTRRKNIELALNTLFFLKEKFPHSVLVITGPLGPHNPTNVEYFSQLLALRRDLHLDNAAYFLAEFSDEFLPDAVIADFYRLADALLFPSIEEGFGIPILEAGLSGIPIFCSDIPPLRALGGDMVDYFSPQSQPSQVAELIFERLSKDPIFNLRTSIRSEYTWEKIYQTKILPLIKS